MQTLRELIALGFSPMLALVIVGISVLFTTLSAVLLAYDRANKAQRAENVARIEILEKAITDSQHKHEICDTARRRMDRQISGMQQQIRILHACPHHECPLKEMLAKMQEDG